MVCEPRWLSFPFFSPFGGKQAEKKINLDTIRNAKERFNDEKIPCVEEARHL